MEKFETKTEVLWDKEKLQQIQSFVKDMNALWLKNWDRKITTWDAQLKIESVRWDWWSYVKFNLTKKWKEVFSYEMKANMFYKENWEDRPVSVTMKIDWKKTSYSGDEKNEHGIYNNYDLLVKAQEYQNDIELMINKKDLRINQKKDLKNLKKEII